jgi:transposase-like protein
MKLNLYNPMAGIVPVGEFVIGGMEKGKVGRGYNSQKKKIVCSVELTDNGKVKSVYALKINNYSSKEFATIFEQLISEQANVLTDQWSGYRSLS